MDDDEISQEIVIKTKDSTEKLIKRWNQLELDLEENLRKAKRDQDVFIQSKCDFRILLSESFKISINMTRFGSRHEN